MYNVTIISYFKWKKHKVDHLIKSYSKRQS